MIDAPRRLLVAAQARSLRQLHLGRLAFFVAYTVAWLMMVYAAQLLLRRLFSGG